MLKICVVTGSRAEYGLLYPLLKKLKSDRSLQLQLLVTAMHLSPEFGLTYKQIEEDGFRIDEKVEMLLSGDTDNAITKSTGLGLIGFADAFERLQPDWVVLTGDRFETLAAAVAAHLAKIPIAHLHGGERSEGAADDAFRHAITKMAYLHFTSTETYRKRVIQLGEQPERVFNTGAIGLDNIKLLDLLSQNQLEKDLNFPAGDQTMLVTFHPVTLEKNTAEKQVLNLLTALDNFHSFFFLFSMPNADANGRIIVKHIELFVKKNHPRAMLVASLGSRKYLSLLKNVRVVIGNSSSGVIEVPYFKKPTVNIGDRQNGRIKPASVIDSGTEVKSIIAGINKALSPGFQATLQNVTQPYGDGNAAPGIVKALKKTGRLQAVKKSFYDLPG